ncbi:MAG: OmpA family protein [Planctomycetota bacterium]
MSDRAEPKPPGVGEELAEHPPQAAAGGGGHGGGARHGHGGGDHGGGHEEHEGAPEWLISFADNVMLQMGFFVILFSLASLNRADGGPARTGEGPHDSNQPTAAHLDWAIAVREAFNNPVRLDSNDPRDALLVQRLRTRAGRGDSAARMNGLRGREHDVHSVRPLEGYGTGGTIPFGDGAAELGEDGRDAVRELARLFRGSRAILEVRGHCSAAEAYEAPDRGMGLSYERARAVAELLVVEGLTWNRLRVTACADGDRVTATAYDQPAQRSNQRVEVIELHQATPEPPPADGAAAGHPSGPRTEPKQEGRPEAAL